MSYTSRIAADLGMKYVSGGLTAAINTTLTLAVPATANYVIIGGNTAAINFDTNTTATANSLPIASTASIAMFVRPGSNIYLYSAGTGKAVYQFFKLEFDRYSALN
jgi:hypothetical protein